MSSALPYLLLVIPLATALVWKASGTLEETAGELARHYHLPPIFRGAVIAAVGSSFPELATTVLSTSLHGEFDLGVAAIVGSAIFNILVIPAVAGLAAGGLRYHRNLVYKDTQFYVTSVAVLLLAFSFAVIYNPRSEGSLTGRMDRPIALVPLALYGLYLFLQQQDVGDYRQREERPEPSLHPGRQWLLLTGSLLLILVAVEGLLRSAIRLGEIFDTPSFLWGITVVAVATSLPDAFVSLRAARKGEGEVSLANVLGSNVFDLLVAIPVGVLIAGSATVDFTVAAPMMGFLTLATVVLLALMRMALALSPGECWSLLALYGLFLAWMVLEALGMTSLVG